MEGVFIFKKKSTGLNVIQNKHLWQCINIEYQLYFTFRLNSDDNIPIGIIKQKIYLRYILKTLKNMIQIDCSVKMKQIIYQPYFGTTVKLENFSKHLGYKGKNGRKGN